MARAPIRSCRRSSAKSSRVCWRGPLRAASIETGGGLGSAAAVERATAKYRKETDVIDRFFADVCVFGPKQKVGKKELFEAWEEWCDENGEESGKQNSFTRTMSERGGWKILR